MSLSFRERSWLVWVSCQQDVRMLTDWQERLPVWVWLWSAVVHFSVRCWWVYWCFSFIVIFFIVTFNRCHRCLLCLQIQQPSTALLGKWKWAKICRCLLNEQKTLLLLNTSSSMDIYHSSKTWCKIISGQALIRGLSFLISMISGYVNLSSASCVFILKTHFIHFPSPN